MTRFDALDSSPPRFARLRTSVFGAVRGNPGVVVAMLFMTSLALLLTTAMIIAATAVPTALYGAFAASPVLVFVSPGASHADVDALGERLRGSPLVADASLRSKDVALAALVQAGLPAPADGRNPLPDVWVVHLRLDGAERAAPNFVTTAVSARDVFASLATVERVRFDENWISLLDRVARRTSSFEAPALAGGLILAALALICIVVLFARSTRLSSPASPEDTKSVLAIVETLIILLSGGIVYLLWTVGMHAAVGTGESLPIVDVLGRNMAVTVAGVSAGTLPIAWLTTALTRVHK